MERRAKIVATIGPACRDEIILEKLIIAGVNIARLNFSHGNHAIHAETIQRIRKISKKLNKPIAIMQDLQGPKIRTGDLGEKGFNLIEGENVTLVISPSPENPNHILIDFPDLLTSVVPGSHILLDDGNLELEVQSVEEKLVIAKVVLGGILKSHKGINFPGTDLKIPGFTAKDKQDLLFGLSHNIDAVAISFVRSAQDIKQVRQAIRENAPDRVDLPIIAKLERPEALSNLEEILELADGVMVARGDLGVEMAPEIVPIAQKQIIAAANKSGKLVITATQMLDSMIHNPRPTRAESTDVANAIFDGTDAVMLSGETAIGKFPIETVEIMDAIILESESYLKEWGHWQGTPTELVEDDATSITRAARELAHDLNVEAIVVFTTSGRTARLMSKALPRVPILGFTANQDTYNRMSFYWGVFPQLIPFANTFDDMLAQVDSAMVSSIQIKPGQQVVVITGFPVGARRLPNLALLYTVGQHK